MAHRVHKNSVGLIVLAKHQLRQLRDIRRDPPRKLRETNFG
jgi:hypothetical protein